MTHKKSRAEYMRNYRKGITIGSLKQQATENAEKEAAAKIPWEEKYFPNEETTEPEKFAWLVGCGWELDQTLDSYTRLLDNEDPHKRNLARFLIADFDNEVRHLEEVAAKLNEDFLQYLSRLNTAERRYSQ